MNRTLLPSIVLAAIASFVAAGCSSSAADSAAENTEPPPSVQPAEIDGDPVQAAYERIPFGAAGFPDVSEFPEEVLLAHLDCVIEQTDGAAPALGSPDESPELPIIYADCAEISGVSEYAAIWRPPTAEELAAWQAEWTESMVECLAEAGYEDAPTVTDPESGAPMLDYEALIAQDPNAQAAVRECENG